MNTDKSSIHPADTQALELDQLVLALDQRAMDPQPSKEAAQDRHTVHIQHRMQAVIVLEARIT